MRGGASLDGAGAHDRESLDPADWDEVEPRGETLHSDESESLLNL